MDDTGKKSPALVSACQPLAVLAVCSMFFSQGYAMDAPSANALADSILSQLGRSKGVVSIPNCGNGQLALAFLQNSGMKVHAFDASQTNVDSTRQLIEPLGKIGPNCTIEKNTFSAMPYVSRFVDCIVITGLTDADLANIAYTEIERILAPDGLAFIGRATSEGGGITQAALQNWINAATKNRSTATVSTTNGTWAVITGQELPRVDVWPMHNYDINGSNYSKDSVASMPSLPQAQMKPYMQNDITGYAGGTVVTSGGRIYEVQPDIGAMGVYGWDCTGNGSQPPLILRVYSIYNGELLWTRDVSQDGLGNILVDPIRAYGRDVYLMRSSGGILQLNGITGAQIGTVASVPTYPISTATMPTNSLTGCHPYHASAYYNFQGNGVICYDFRNNIAINAQHNGASRV